MPALVIGHDFAAYGYGLADRYCCIVEQANRHVPSGRSELNDLYTTVSGPTVTETSSRKKARSESRRTTIPPRTVSMSPLLDMIFPLTASSPLPGTLEPARTRLAVNDLSATSRDSPGNSQRSFARGDQGSQPVSPDPGFTIRLRSPYARTRGPSCDRNLPAAS